MCLHRGSAYRQTISSHTPKTEYRLLVGERELCAIIREKHCDPWSQRIMEYCIIKFMKFEGSSAWKQGKDFSFKCPILQEMKLWNHQSHRHSSTPLPKPVPALLHHSTRLESHGDFLKNVWVSHWRLWFSRSRRDWKVLRKISPRGQSCVLTVKNWSSLMNKYRSCSMMGQIRHCSAFPPAGGLLRGLPRTARAQEARIPAQKSCCCFKAQRMEMGRCQNPQ